MSSNDKAGWLAPLCQSAASYITVRGAHGIDTFKYTFSE